MSAFAGSRRYFRVNVRVNVGVKKMTEKSIFAFTFTLTLSFVDPIGEMSNFSEGFINVIG